MVKTKKNVKDEDDIITIKVNVTFLTYRVSHIKLDRVNGSKLRFGGQIRKFKKNESFLKMY